MPEFIPGVGSDIKDPDSKELAYLQLPVTCIKQIYALTAVTQDLLPRVKCPTLVMHSREDHVVSPANGPVTVRLLGASRVELLWLENSYHVATIDNDKDLIVQRTIEFINSIAE
jgi:carboxylesterase